MTRLLRVELDRFVTRRAVALLLLAALATTVLLASAVAWDTRPHSEAELTEARSQVATAAADPRLQRELEQCRERPEDFFGPGASTTDCAELAPRVEDFVPRERLALDRVADNRGALQVAVVAALLVVAGAMYAGGDWSTGSVAQQLLFGPGRTRLWLAKAGAVTAAAAVAAVVLLGGFWAALVLVARARGVEVPDAVLDDVVGTATRGVALAAGGALGGYALAMLLGGTAVTLGLLLAAVVAGELLVLTLPVGRPDRFGLSTNVSAWIEGGTRVLDTGVSCAPGRGGCYQSYVLGAAHGATYLLLLLAVAVAVSLLAFRRRDVR